jgi:hypothetical protein
MEGIAVFQTDHLAMAGKIAQLRRECLSHAAHSDRALLAASRLIELEGQLEEGALNSPTYSLDTDHRALIHQAADELQRDEDPFVTHLGTRLADLVRTSHR